MLSLLSAFALPRRATDLNGTSLQTLLIPISRPTYRIANAIRGRFETQPVEDTRDSLDIKRENLALKQQIQNDVRRNRPAPAACRRTRQPRRVSKPSATGLKSPPPIAASTKPSPSPVRASAALRLDQPVLSSGSVIALIGRISRAGEMAAQVRLITDPGFTVTGHFVSYSAASGATENKNLTAIVTGRGNGANGHRQPSH